MSNRLIYNRFQYHHNNNFTILMFRNKLVRGMDFLGCMHDFLEALVISIYILMVCLFIIFFKGGLTLSSVIPLAFKYL
jgi:hypothetical protein